MLILKIALVVAVLFGIVTGIKRFNEHCFYEFGHEFFTWRAYWQTVIGFCLILVGLFRWNSAAQQHGDTLNGLLVIAMGIAVLIWLVYVNLKRTGLFYGIGGTVVQLSLFYVLVWIGVPVLILVLICQGVVLATARPVYIANR